MLHLIQLFPGINLGAAVTKVAPRCLLDIISLKCVCSSAVEHLLAKEDVASSSLVTCSTEAFGEATGKAVGGTEPSLLAMAPQDFPHYICGESGGAAMGDRSR